MAQGSQGLVSEELALRNSPAPQAATESGGTAVTSPPDDDGKTTGAWLVSLYLNRYGLHKYDLHSYGPVLVSMYRARVPS